ncbi:MAG TPA: tetratricopeptide repeat protein, partial [Thermoanaerobaculia bacterium]|nr:tetratricopeptide repeat protein [Thermoanaerobaculia bacterium]
MHPDGRRIPVAAGRAPRADRRLTPSTRLAFVCCAAAIIASAVALFAELSTAQIEEASEVGRRAAVILLPGERRSFGNAIATDAIAAKFFGEDVWGRLSGRQRELVRTIIVERFQSALIPPVGAPAEIAWSSARPEGETVQLFLGLKYPAGVLKTRWSLARFASGWKVQDVLLSDPGISLATEAARTFGRDGIRRRDPGREARAAALPRALGILAILAIVLVFARRLAPPTRKILVWTALAPAALFAVDGVLVIRRVLSEPYRIPEVLSPAPWSVAERQAIVAQREGNLDAARRHWQVAVAAGAPAAAADYQIGVALAAAGRRDEAKAAFLRALSRSPSAPGAAKELGLIALAEGRSEEARDR